jgi:hypothetical protein
VRRGDVCVKDARGFEAEDRSDALATGEDAVAHGFVNGRRLRRRCRHKAIEGGVNGEAVFLEVGGEFHE